MTVCDRMMLRRAFVAGACALALGGAVEGLLPTPAKGKKGKDKDCKDFKTQKKAQKFFKRNGGPQEDPHNLDGDNDGKACESLP